MRLLSKKLMSLGLGVCAILALVHCVGDDPASSSSTATDAGSDASSDGQPTTGGASLTLAKTQLSIVQSGAAATLPFTIARGTTTGALVAHATELPAGVTAQDVTVADGASSGTLSFSAGASAALGVVAPVAIALESGTQALDQKNVNVEVTGAPGTLDTTFGTAGIATFSVQFDSAAQPVAGARVALYTSGLNVGKIVVAGTVTVSSTDVEYVVARLNADGSLDNGFGLPNGGVRLGYQVYSVGVTSGETVLRSIAIDSQDRILVFGRHDDVQGRADLIRFTTTGDLDGSFTPYWGSIHGTFSGDAISVVAGPGDLPIVLAQWNFSASTTETLLQRFTDAGAFDPSFAGPVTLQLPSRDSTYLQPLSLDSAGHLLSAGMRCNGGAVAPLFDCDAVLVRATSDGNLDSTFGDVGADGGKGGFTIVRSSSDGGVGFEPDIYGLAIDTTTNDVLLAGSNDTGSSSTVDRFKSDGTPVTTFGTNGRLLINAVAGSTSQAAMRGLFDHNGNIVVVGSRTSPSEIYRTRLSGAGVTDATYADQGVGTSPLGAQGSPDALLLPDDRLVIAAEVDGSPTQLAVYRYWP